MCPELRTAAILGRRTPTPRALGSALRHLGILAELRGDAAQAQALVAAAADVEHRTARELRPILRGTGEAPAPLAPALAHLRELVSQGVNVYVDIQETRLPQDLAGLIRARSLGDALALHRRQPVVTVSDLRAFCDQAQPGPVDDAPALCQDLEPLIARIRAPQPRMLLGRALAIIEPLVVRCADEIRLSLVPVGGPRRFEPTVGDILLLAASDSPDVALARMLASFEPADIRHRSDRTVSFVIDRQEVNLRFVASEHLGAALLHYTGSAAHVDRLRRRAAARGLRLTAQGLFAGNTLRPSATEAEVYAALDLPEITPELRHGLDEIELAEQGRLADLVTVADVRGDLHVHTLWSDGRDSTEGIVWAALALGYEYVAITDHSPTAAAARVLSIDRLRQQAAEIDALRAKHSGITILHGAEVDILGDGTLDFPDTILEGLDIVLASLHESQGHGPDRLLDRYTRAMAHPLVNVITHPANRMPGRSEGYGLDWARFFDVAARTRTAIEVDGAPGHLDLDGHLARHAVEAGAVLTVDSDGHFADRLGRQMRMGVGTARRGAVGAGHVLNTRSVADVRAFVAAKRRG